MKTTEANNSTATITDEMWIQILNYALVAVIATFFLVLVYNLYKKSILDIRYIGKSFYKVGRKFNEIKTRFWLIVLFVLGFAIFSAITTHNLHENETEGGLSGFYKVFWEHGWLEILSGLILYFLLEFRITKYGEVPTEDGKRDYTWMLESIEKSKTTIRILDNDFSSFFQDRRHLELKTEKEKRKVEREERKAINNLRKKIEGALKKLGDNEKIQILLLHPNTLAAQQRHDDLQFYNYKDNEQTNNGTYSFIFGGKKKNLKEEFDLFENMNKGLQVLYDIIVEISKVPELIREDKLKKLEVKLFKTSYSFVFVSWDRFVNFSLISPDKLTDEETFKTTQNTPLANYLNKNFQAIWDAKETVPLEEYKKLTLMRVNGEKLHNDPQLLDWGPDSYDYNLPIFICIDNDQITSDIKDGTSVQVKHDSKYLLATLLKIPSTSGTDDLYQFAKKQIANKNNLRIEDGKYIKEKYDGSLVANDKCFFDSKTIYKVKYSYQRRIMLRDVDYVNRHLKTDKKYSYTPYTKYAVHLGLHLRKTLHALYDFYTEFYDDFLPENYDYKKEPYKRILSQYKCCLKEDGDIKIKSIGEKESTCIDRIESQPREIDYLNFEAAIKKCEYQIKEESVENTKREKSKLKILSDLNIFIERTIYADLLRINGVRTDKKIEKKSYIVTINLIRVKVDKDVNTEDSHITGYHENTGEYTVLHFVGKKNIIGGMPIIYKAPKNADGSINENKKEMVRTYNFSNALDSIYINHALDGDGNIKVIDSSGVKYDETEAKHRKQKLENDVKKHYSEELSENEKKELNEELSHQTDANKFGYRNVIAIEFHK